MNIEQMIDHRDLLQAIVRDVNDLEQMTFGTAINPEHKQRILLEKLNGIRQAAHAGLNDRDAIVRAILGYRQDCLDSLSGFQGLLEQTLEAIEEDGVVEPDDGQLQLLGMAARNAAERVESYLQYKDSLEVDNG